MFIPTFFVRVALLAAIGIFAVCLPNQAAGPAGNTGPISVEDVIRLAKAGISEEIIIQQIRRKGAPPQITADQIIALRNASVTERTIRALLESPGPSARSSTTGANSPATADRRAAPTPQPVATHAVTAPPPKVAASAERGSAPPPGTGGWVSHTDPMGFTLNHPPGWKVDTDPKLGRLSVQGDRGERLVVWPMFLENRELDSRRATALVLQLASKLEGQMSWTAPKVSGRFVVTGSHTAQRRQVVMMTWANSPSGTSLLLYSVAAPADSFASATPVLARLLQSFQILNPPPGTGGASGSRAAPGPVQYVRWTDPLENAFSLSVPQGWKVIGGMYRFAPTDTRPEMTMLAPGGGMLIKLGQKDFGIFMDPIHTPMGSMTSGSLPQNDGSKIQILSYLPGQQFARYYVERARQECGAVRVTSNNNRPDLVAEIAQQAQADQIPSGRITVGDVTFACTAQGTELRGYYLASTIQLPTDAARRGQGGSMWFVYRLGGYLSVPEWQQSAESIARVVVKSVQVNPQWVAMSRQMSHAVVAQDIARSQDLQRRAFAAIAENQRQTSDLISKSYWAQQARYDEISRKRENGILGTVDVINPTTGESYKVQYNSNYYWMNDAGYAAGTLTRDSPGVGWQEMMQLP